MLYLNRPYLNFRLIIFYHNFMEVAMDRDIVCSIVVPMYNEEEVIEETYKRLKRVMDETG